MFVLQLCRWKVEGGGGMEEGCEKARLNSVNGRGADGVREVLNFLIPYSIKLGTIFVLKEKSTSIDVYKKDLFHRIKHRKHFLVY
jgi:hypothetical protein